MVDWRCFEISSCQLILANLIILSLSLELEEIEEDVAVVLEEEALKEVEKRLKKDIMISASKVYKYIYTSAQHFTFASGC